jgi:DNA polymerase I
MCVKCRFYLLDINDANSQGKPCVRLWSIDEKGRRIALFVTQIMPYFYYALAEGETADAIKTQLLNRKSKFPEVISIIAEDRKLLGHTRRVLKVVCSDADVLAKYARDIRKSIGKGELFEEDLRLSVRYVTDSMVHPCGWHECEVEQVQVDGISHEAYIATETPRIVSDLTIPNMRILAFKLLTVEEKGSAKPDRNPVRAIAIASNSGKVELLHAGGQDDSDVLKVFVSKVKQIDPDVIVGYESNKLDWPYLIARAKALKVKLEVGRDGSQPHTSVYGHVSIAGRATLDILEVAGGISEIKVKTIENIAKYMRVPSAERVVTVEESDRFGLWVEEVGKKKLIEHVKVDVEALLELAEAMMPFPMQLSALTGLPLDHVMTAAVGFRVDSYLMKQAHRIEELIPPRNEQPYFTYRGALVLEPRTGLHEDIAVLDFASMYPHLMINYNLSPDTLVKPGERVDADKVYVIPEVGHRFYKEPAGFYKTVLQSLLEERAKVRQQLETHGEKSTAHRVLEERERAVKIIANACYGYAGWAGARWYVREVAESATALGREAITKAVAKAESLGLKIIYGDTDSIFVQNEREKIEVLIKWVEKELGLEIRIERIYVRILFTEAMKRYAGLLPDDTLDIVGLEVIRGDWSELAQKVQSEVLERILRGQSPDKAIADVREIIGKLRKGQIPIADLTIRKTLTKPIEEYKVRTPHVEVAKKLLKQGWELTVGDKVAYIVTNRRGKLFEKAEPYNRVQLKDVDVDYYLDNQIKPAAMRILELFGVNEKALIA